MLRTSQNYEIQKGEISTQVSQTVPDQHMSIKEILVKYANGTLSDVNIQPQFNEEQEDLRGLDYVQLHQIAQENKHNIDELQKKLKKEEENKKRKAQDASKKYINDLKSQIEELKKQIK